MRTFLLCFGGFLDNYTICLETVRCLHWTHICSIYVTQPIVLEYYNLINVYIRQTQLIFWHKTSSYMFRLSASCVQIHKGAKLFNYCICCCKLTQNWQQLMHKYLIIARAYVHRHCITITQQYMHNNLVTAYAGVNLRSFYFYTAWW